MNVRTQGALRKAAKVFLIAVLAVLIIALLFTVVFPWIDRTFVTNPVLNGA